MFRQRSISRWQQHALAYALYLEERTQAEAKAIEIERMTLNLAGYDRWVEIYAPPEFEPQPLSFGGRDVEEVVDDIDEIDRYFERLQSGEKFSMSGADDEGWV